MNAPHVANLTRQQYHDHPAVSSHKLSDFRRSPLYYYRKNVQKVIPEFRADYLTFGEATHALTLEGRAAYDARFAVRPDGIDGRTKEGKVALAAFRESCNGKEVLDRADADLVEKLAARVHANKHAAELLSVGCAERMLFAKHEATGLQLRGMADWDAVSYGCDLKTCTSLDTFAADAARYGYAEQAAFYRHLFGWARVFLIAVEKAEPNRVAVYRLTDQTLDAAHERNEATLAALWQSYDRDDWPGDPAAVIDLDIPAAGAA